MAAWGSNIFPQVAQGLAGSPHLIAIVAGPGQVLSRKIEARMQSAGDRADAAFRLLEEWRRNPEAERAADVREQAPGTKLPNPSGRHRQACLLQVWRQGPLRREGRRQRRRGEELHKEWVLEGRQRGLPGQCLQGKPQGVPLRRLDGGGRACQSGHPVHAIHGWLRALQPQVS